MAGSVRMAGRVVHRLTGPGQGGARLLEMRYGAPS